MNFSPTSPGLQTAGLIASYIAANSQNVQITSHLSGTGTVPVQMSANGDHTCATNQIGQLFCWGHKNNGQLGIGTAVNLGDEPSEMSASLAPINLGAGRYPVKISTGFFHTCAILDDGSVRCWGWNNSGQLGLGTSNQTVGDQPNQMGSNLLPVNLGTNLKATSIVAGYAHTCAILSTGGVKCWGLNVQGQLGLGDSQ